MADPYAKAAGKLLSIGRGAVEWCVMPGKYLFMDDGILLSVDAVHEKTFLITASTRKVDYIYPPGSQPSRPVYWATTRIIPLVSREVRKSISKTGLGLILEQLCREAVVMSSIREVGS